jgi:hypothetical protein
VSFHATNGYIFYDKFYRKKNLERQQKRNQMLRKLAIKIHSGDTTEDDCKAAGIIL